MPQNMVHLTVMVASPKDVVAEREHLEDVVRELNATWSKTLGVYLDLMHWETSAYPGIGTDPQDVINRQLGDDYDIFIGLLWHRLGSPTPRALSGTAEEFERAYKKYLHDPDSVKIMFYFKDTPVSPSEIDPIQFAKVTEFRNALGGEGVLYWTFNDRETFGRLLRVHLTRQVQELRKIEQPGEVGSIAASPAQLSIPEKSEALGEDIDEEGLFDLLERGSEGSDILGQILSRMTETIQGLGDRVKSRGEELKDGLEDLGAQERVKRAKSISNQVAADLEQFAASMDAEMGLFSSKHRSTIDAWIKFVDLQGDFSEDSARAALESLRSLKKSMVETRGQMSSMKDTIASLPRMTTAFNRGKRKAVAALEQFDKELYDGILLLAEIDPDGPAVQS